jgi:tetratricopeptide (TPR) repeat protein
LKNPRNSIGSTSLATLGHYAKTGACSAIAVRDTGIDLRIAEVFTLAEKPLFSIVLIARNESESLPCLIESLRQFQDRGGEIYLLDTGSIDETANLARSLGCRVEEVGEKFVTTLDKEMSVAINERFVVENESPIVQPGMKFFNYADARNYAAAMSKTDFIFTPDCDEEYRALDIDAINAAIREGMEQAEYMFAFSLASDNVTPIIKFRHCKAYDRRRLRWNPETQVHEVLIGNANRCFFKENVIYLVHHQRPQAHRSSYLAGLALHCYLFPDSDRNSHYFGRELVWAGRPKSAIRELRRHIAMNRWQQERGQSACFIGEAYLNMGQDAEALQALHEAICIDGTRREPWMRLAEYWWRKNDHQRTASYAAAALEVPYTDYYGNNMAHYRQAPHELLYWACYWLGDREKAKRHWEKALEYDPKNPKYLEDRQFFT